MKSTFKKDAGKDFDFLKTKLEESGDKDELEESLKEEIKSA